MQQQQQRQRRQQQQQQQQRRRRQLHWVFSPTSGCCEYDEFAALAAVMNKVHGPDGVELVEAVLTLEHEHGASTAAGTTAPATFVVARTCSPEKTTLGKTMKNNASSSRNLVDSAVGASVACSS